MLLIDLFELLGFWMEASEKQANPKARNHGRSASQNPAGDFMRAMGGNMPVRPLQSAPAHISSAVTEFIDRKKHANR